MTLCLQPSHWCLTCLTPSHETRGAYEAQCQLYMPRLTEPDWIIKPVPLVVLLEHPVDAKSVKYSDHSRCVSCQSGLLIYLFCHHWIFYFYFKSPIAQRDVELLCLRCGTRLHDEGSVHEHRTRAFHIIPRFERCHSSPPFPSELFPSRRRLQCWTLEIYMNQSRFLWYKSNIAPHSAQLGLNSHFYLPFPDWPRGEKNIHVALI